MAAPEVSEREDSERQPDGAAALYSRELHRYLVARLLSREDAADLAQEAYLRYLQLPDASVVRKPSGYLFRIALHLISEWRLRRDRSPVSFDSELAEKYSKTWTGSGVDTLERLVNRERLEQVLEQIPLTYRRVLLMSKCDGLTSAQIAQELNVTRETVDRYLVRATAFARKARWD